MQLHSRETRSPVGAGPGGGATDIGATDADSLAGKPVTALILTIAGWLSVIVGILIFPTPGPGVFLIFLGLVLLSRRHGWARKLLGPARRAALYGASEGVQSWFRISQSVLLIVLIGGLGAVWLRQPPAPAWWPVSETWWLVGGIGPGFVLLLTSVLMIALLAYSFLTFRKHPFDPGADRAEQRRRAAEAGSGAAAAAD